ncbi:hypothetical protein TrRE_jg1452, partial [Triparma retinervis]
MEELYSDDLYSDIPHSALPVSSLPLGVISEEGTTSKGGVEFLAGPEEEGATEVEDKGNEDKGNEEDNLMKALASIQATVDGLTELDYGTIMDDPPRWEDNPKFDTIQYRDAVNHESTRVISTRSLPSQELRTIRISKLPPAFATDALVMQYFRCLHVTVQQLEVSISDYTALIQVGTMDQAGDLLEEGFFKRDDVRAVLNDRNLKDDLPLERRPVRQTAADRAKEIKAISLRHGDILDPA